MAAGVGSRFGGTKQLAEVGPAGEAMLDYTIADARRAGFGPVVVVVRTAIRDAVAEHLARFHEDADTFTLVCQDLDTRAAAAGVPPRERPWGTAHAVLSARDHVRSPFAVVNADDYYGAAGLFDLAGAFAEPGGTDEGTFHLVAYRLGNTLSPHGTVSRGVCTVGEDGCLVNVTEHLALRLRPDGRVGQDDAAGTSFTSDTLVSTNLWGLQPSLFGHLAERFATFAPAHREDPRAEFQLPTVIDELVREGDVVVRVRPTESAWLGMTYVGDLDEARRRMAEVAQPVEPPP